MVSLGVTLSEQVERVRFPFLLSAAKFRELTEEKLILNLQL